MSPGATEPNPTKEGVAFRGLAATLRGVSEARRRAGLIRS